VTFTIYYRIDAGESYYFPIGSYIVNIYKNISNVWNANTINFNTDNIQNSSINNEIIYIGSKDDVIKRVKIDILVDFEDGFDYDKELNLKVDHLLGVQASSNLIKIYNGRITTLDVYLNDITISSPDDMENFYQLEYKLFNADGIEITDEEILNNIKVTVRSIKTRISVYYGSEECDIYKTFKILNITEYSDGSKTEYPIKVTIGQTYVVGAYYAERIIDAKFDTQHVELSTGQSVSLLAKNSTITSVNHSFVLNMRHISDNIPYELKDIAENTITFSIGTVTGNSVGYLRVTPLTAKYSDNKEYVYDYIFLAMGAPNDAVTVVLDFVITVDGSTSATIPITFVISNDYKGLVKKNTDGTDNSDLNRNRILATSTQMSDNVYTFATAGAAKADYDFLFIEHSNIIEGAVTGNVIPYFAITVDNEGQSYIRKREQTEHSMDLVFSFIRCEFGNVNIDLTFRDDFGYTFVYYITLVASYNPVYLTTSAIIYEQDGLVITNEADMDTSSNLLRVKFEKADETFASIDATTPSVEISEVKFAFTVVRGSGASITTENKLITSTDNVNKHIVLNNRVSGKYSFTINILPDDFYSTNETEIKGKLSIVFVYKGISKEISVDVIVKQLYSLKTVDDTVYVRDGVAFSLIDIVEVINNKNSVKVGEKTITNEDTAYIKYSLTRKDGTEFTIDGCEEVGLSLGIQAYNRNSGKYTTMALSEVGSKTISYTSLQGLFGSEVSIANCDFRLVFWDPEGNINQIKKEVKSGVFESYTIRAGDDNGASTEVKFYAYYPKDKGGDLITDQPMYLQSTAASVVVDGAEYFLEYSENLNKNNYYTFSIQSGYIIKDQILTIGLRKITNYTSSNINVYFQNGTSGYKTLVINCDTDETRKISLCEYGIITSGRYTDFYTGIIDPTGKKIIVVNGMSEDDRAKLKDISFNEVKVDGTLATLQKYA
ncbi:MAG: hypothetical protein J6Q51_00380, partial [Clostridia bacterium]|nr:hypothetical protein [Clostridia bacterium]